MIRDAFPRDQRTIEPRLSHDMPWAPLRKATRGSADSQDRDRLVLRVRATKILGDASRSASTDRLHATAIAGLALGETADAIRTLRGIDEAVRTASIWSDLAAAHYVASHGWDGPAQLKNGLAAASRALELDPRLPEARFVRAMLLERLGLRDAALEAWHAYLAVDSTSPWSGEARERASLLEVDPKQFRDLLEQAYPRIETVAGDLASQFAQEARTWGETEILGRWSDAHLAKNDGEAKLHLDVARALGTAVQSLRGESLLVEAVSRIDTASHEQRTKLAVGHSAYRRARIEYSRQNATSAEPSFRSAAAILESAGSPMHLVARYYAASARYDRNDINTARSELTALGSRTPAQFIALRAQIGWAVGLAEAAHGHFSKAIGAWRESERLFRLLDERMNAASVLGLLGDAHETLGAFDASWRERMAAVIELGQTRTPRAATVLSGAARTAIRQRDWLAASAFLDIEIDTARTTGPPQLLVDGLLRRAYVGTMREDFADAFADLNEARRITASIPDAAHRLRLDADAAWTEATLSMSAKPAEAERLFSAAIEFHVHAGRRSFLPDLYLGRARAKLRAGNVDGARHDLLEGIAQLENERSQTPAGERLGIFDTVAELFEEAIALDFDGGRIREAFDLAERSRARVLLDTWGGTYRPFSPSDITGDTTILEYAFVKNRLITFIANHHGVDADARDVDRANLQSTIDAYRAALERNDGQTAERFSTALHDILIADRFDRHGAGTRLVIVPTGHLERVPFAALTSRTTRRFLVEDATIVIAPSVATHLLASQRPRRYRHLLAVADPFRADQPRLDGSRAETARISRLYEKSAILAGAEATTDAFLSKATTADVIHYAGHAVADDDSGAPSLLLAHGARLDIHDIATMKLRAPVVVLAACATASGAPRGSEGAASLARAFLSAGAPTVAASLWPIEDNAAAELFTSFHRALQQGMPPADALRSVQLDAIRASQTARATLLWTSFEIIGS